MAKTMQNGKNSKGHMIFGFLGYIYKALISQIYCKLFVFNFRLNINFK